RPNYTWAFAGWGPLDPSSWNLQNVRVFRGLPRERIAALYAASDVFVLPSFGEGFPMVIQEALACGLPVVCGEETLLADPKIAEHVRGVTVTAGNDERTAAEFVSAVDKVLKSDAVEGRSHQRRAFSLTRYSWGQAVTSYLD